MTSLTRVRSSAPAAPRAALAVGGFLPHAEVPASPDGAAVALRSSGREATALVRVHDAACAGCRRWLAELAAVASDLAAWDGRVLVLVPGPVADASALRDALRLPFVVASDPEARASLPGGAGVAIADRYGQVYDVAAAGDAHALPAPREVEEWLRFLATQCPE